VHRRFLILLAAAALIASPKKTPLDEYVAKPDPAFQWKLAHKVERAKSTGYILEMTSQSWGEDKKVDRTKWQHTVTVVSPKELKSNIGLLFITGGANDGRPRTTVDGVMAGIAEATGSVVTELRMVPNQPLVFADDPKPGSSPTPGANIWRRATSPGRCGCR
jgi:PhoPQ-activated pathogenicity-related protein